LAANATELLAGLRGSAADRVLPGVGAVCGWHAALYEGCRVPVRGYIGHLRGDPTVAELVGYEVGVGPEAPDGYPEKMGVWSVLLPDAVDGLLAATHAALTRLDEILPVGVRPASVDELDAVVGLTARVHGEWVRLHPFANGNGRIARVWAAWLAVRYGLPVFVTVKPRPDDLAYARAARDSMGRPPDFAGDHQTATAVFAHLLTLTLLP